jgi:hypothetical protein
MSTKMEVSRKSTPGELMIGYHNSTSYGVNDWLKPLATQANQEVQLNKLGKEQGCTLKRDKDMV